MENYIVLIILSFCFVALHVSAQIVLFSAAFIPFHDHTILWSLASDGDDRVF